MYLLKWLSKRAMKIVYSQRLFPAYLGSSLSLGGAFVDGSWSGTSGRMGRLADNGGSTVSTSYLEVCLLLDSGRD